MNESSSFLSDEQTEDLEKSDESESEINEKEMILSDDIDETKKQKNSSSKDMESSMEDEVFLSGESSKSVSGVQRKWKSAIHRSLKFKDEESVCSSIEMQEMLPDSDESKTSKAKRPRELPLHNEKPLRKRVKSLFLSDGAQHAVFLPKNASLSSSQYTFANLVDNMAKYPKTPNTPLENLKERQWEFDCHTQATKEVFKEQTEEFINCYDGNPCKPKLTMKDVTKKVTERLNSQTTPKMASVVDELLRQRKQNLITPSDETENTPQQTNQPKMSVPSMNDSHHKPRQLNKVVRQSSLDAGTVVPIPVENLRRRASQVRLNIVMSMLPLANHTGKVHDHGQAH